MGETWGAHYMPVWAADTALGVCQKLLASGTNGSGLQEYPGWTCTCSPAAVPKCRTVFKFKDQVLAASWLVVPALSKGPHTCGVRMFQYQSQLSSLGEAAWLGRLAGFPKSVPEPCWFTNRHESHSPKQDLAPGKWCKGNFFYKLSEQVFL